MKTPRNQMKTLEQYTEEYFNGTRDEIGHEPFDDFVIFLERFKTDLYNYAVAKDDNIP